MQIEFFNQKMKFITPKRMHSTILNYRLRVAFCAVEMAGELFRNLWENLPVEGACPRLWFRAGLGHKWHQKQKKPLR